MGNFYTNVTLRTADGNRIVQVLREKGLTAYIAPPQRLLTVVFDRASEEQDPAVIDATASHLSERLDCAALAVLNHDDDLLWYGLYEHGDLIDEYSSAPGYFEGDPRAPEGGDAARLCRAFGAEGRATAVDALLRRPGGSDEGFVFEVERHQALVEALGLPDFCVGVGFNYIEEGELPEGLSPDQLQRVGPSN